MPRSKKPPEKQDRTPLHTFPSARIFPYNLKVHVAFTKDKRGNLDATIDINDRCFISNRPVGLPDPERARGVVLSVEGLEHVRSFGVPEGTPSNYLAFLRHRFILTLLRLYYTPEELLRGVAETTGLEHLLVKPSNAEPRRKTGKGAKGKVRQK